jgi:pyruvate dehydrogenase E1 component alpha subunit
MPDVAVDKSLPAKAKSPVPAPLNKWVRIYQAMKQQRLLDEKMVLLQRQGRIGFYGPITGQEAATIGSVSALEKQDWVVPALREAGAALFRGLPMDQFIAQLYGNSLDWIQGRQMPCHYTYKDGRYVSMSSCIATQLPHAVGIAMAAQYQKKNEVVLAYLGDGATSEGDFHSAMNFAGVYKTPVVFFCQNNQWAISVPVRSQTASKSIAMKAAAYGFDGVQVDGNDAVKVHEVTKKAVDKARRGGGPTLIEALTYRIGGHTTSDDPSRYRNEKETAAWAKKDPVDRMRKYLVSKKLWSTKQEKDFEDQITARIKKVVDEVEKAPPPPVKSIFEDVYAQMPWHLREQMKEASRERA